MGLLTIPKIISNETRNLTPRHQTETSIELMQRSALGPSFSHDGARSCRTASISRFHGPIGNPCRRSIPRSRGATAVSLASMSRPSTGSPARSIRTAEPQHEQGPVPAASTVVESDASSPAERSSCWPYGPENVPESEGRAECQTPLRTDPSRIPSTRCTLLAAPQ
jgi:hypothetical protein